MKEPNVIPLSIATPGGHPAVFHIREGTSDISVIHAMLLGDEYHLHGRNLSGWAMDVGSHIGGATVHLGLDYPDLKIIAIEPVPENAALLRWNVEANGLANRVVVVEAAAGRPGQESAILRYGYRHWEGDDNGAASDAYLAHHRYVAESFSGRGEPEVTLTVPVTNLGFLLDNYGIETLALMKIDCEGGEWGFLSDPAVARVQTIVGEYHCGLPEDPWFHADARIDMVKFLAPTHEVFPWTNDTLVGDFEATRRLP